MGFMLISRISDEIELLFPDLATVNRSYLFRRKQALLFNVTAIKPHHLFRRPRRSAIRRLSGYFQGGGCCGGLTMALFDPVLCNACIVSEARDRLQTRI